MKIPGDENGCKVQFLDGGKVQLLNSSVYIVPSDGLLLLLLQAGFAICETDTSLFKATV